MTWGSIPRITGGILLGLGAMFLSRYDSDLATYAYLCFGIGGTLLLIGTILGILEIVEEAKSKKELQ